MSRGSQRSTLSATAGHGAGEREHRKSRAQHVQNPGGATGRGELAHQRVAGQSMAPPIRAEMEARFGENFADVRIHNDAAAHRSAAELHAKAYTLGNDVAFSAGRYEPAAGEGKRLLAHELAHVVQQRRGGPPPELNPHAAHESAADRAADVVARGDGPVSVGAGTSVGIARDDEHGAKKKHEHQTSSVPARAPKRRAEEKRQTSAVPARLPKQRAKANIETITAPQKAVGVLGEATVPFELYSDPSWNNLGGGEETGSSRMSLARQTRWGKTGGIDYLVENRTTGRLVIGEQKRLGTTSFDNATATTVNLEKNIANTAQRLREGIKAGRVHPDEIAHVQNTIERLEQTGKAIERRGSLPEEVVFELTGVGGKGGKIGKGYIDLLAKKYGDNPEFIEHLLARTFIRGKGMGRNPAGKVGTNTDPDVIPAREVMTDAAKSELQRLKARKTPKEWKDEKEKEKQAREKEQKRIREEERKANRERRAAETQKLKAEARKIGDETRQKKLEQLREEAKRSGEPEPETKAERRLLDNKRKAQAKQAGRDAQKKFLDDARQRARQEAQKRKASSEPRDKARGKAQAESATAKSPARQQATPESGQDLKPAGQKQQTSPQASNQPESKTQQESGKPKASAPDQPTLKESAPTETMPKETRAPTLESAGPKGAIEPVPGGLTPKGAVEGALGVAGALGAVSGVKDIVKEFKEGHPGTALVKTGVLGLSFVGEAAPPLFAAGVIMNYWGPRHQKIEDDSFEVGQTVENALKDVPGFGFENPEVRRVVGGIASAGAAVGESVGYTLKDMGSAVVDGAETLGGLAEDAWDWLTD